MLKSHKRYKELQKDYDKDVAEVLLCAEDWTELLVTADEKLSKLFTFTPKNKTSKKNLTIRSMFIEDGETEIKRMYGDRIFGTMIKYYYDYLNK